MHVLNTRMEPNDHMRERAYDEGRKHDDEEENMTHETDNDEEEKSMTQKHEGRAHGPGHDTNAFRCTIARNCTKSERNTAFYHNCGAVTKKRITWVEREMKEGI